MQYIAYQYITMYIIVTEDMSFDATQPYVGPPGAPPGDDDDRDKKPLVGWVAPFANDDETPVVIGGDDWIDDYEKSIENSMPSHFSETNPSFVPETSDEEDDPDPVTQTKRTVKVMVAAIQGLGSMPSNGGHYGPAVPPAASTDASPGAQPPIPSGAPRGPPPNRPAPPIRPLSGTVVKQEGEAELKQATKCLGFNPNPWIDGTRCLFSQALAAGGYLPSHIPKGGFMKKPNPRLCLGCMKKKGPDVVRTQLPRDERVHAFDPDAAGAPSAAVNAADAPSADAADAPSAAAAPFTPDPRGGKTSKRSKSSIPTPTPNTDAQSVRVRSHTQIGAWDRKANEQSIKAKKDALAAQQRALAQSQRRELQAHNAALKASKESAKDREEAQAKFDAVNAQMANQMATAQATMQAAEATIKEIQAQNAELLRRVVAAELQASPAPAPCSRSSGKEAMSADEDTTPVRGGIIRKRRLPSSQVPGRGEGGSSSWMSSAAEGLVSLLGPGAPAPAGEGGSSSRVATEGGGEGWGGGEGCDRDDDFEIDHNGYGDFEAEESQQGDKTPKPKTPRRDVSFIGYRGQPRRLNAGDTLHPGLRGVSYSPHETSGSDRLTGGSDFCHLTGMPFDKSQDTVVQAQHEFYDSLIQQGKTHDQALAKVDDPVAMAGFLKDRAKEERRYRLSERNEIKQEFFDWLMAHWALTQEEAEKHWGNKMVLKTYYDAMHPRDALEEDEEDALQDDATRQVVDEHAQDDDAEEGGARPPRRRAEEGGARRRLRIEDDDSEDPAPGDGEADQEDGEANQDGEADQQGDISDEY